MHPTPSSPRTSSRPVLDPPVEHRVRRLVDQQRRAHSRGSRRPRAVRSGGVRRDAGVQRPARAHRRVERAHRLLERRVRVEPVRVEDVDVVEAHPPQRLVEARQQVLPRAPLPVRPGPHVVAGLGRDDQLVAVRPEVARQDPAEVLLGRAVRRAVVVGQVEVRDPEVERPPQDLALRVDRPVVAEVVPQAERDGRQPQPAPPAPAVGASSRSGRSPAARSSVRRVCHGRDGAVAGLFDSSQVPLTAPLGRGARASGVRRRTRLPAGEEERMNDTEERKPRKRLATAGPARGGARGRRDPGRLADRGRGGVVLVELVRLVVVELPGSASAIGVRPGAMDPAKMKHGPGETLLTGEHGGQGEGRRAEASTRAPR